MQADKNELPEYTGTLGTAGDQAAPTIDKPVADIRGLSDKPSETQASAEQTQASQVLGNASGKADSARLPETGESQSDSCPISTGKSQSSLISSILKWETQGRIMIHNSLFLKG